MTSFGGQCTVRLSQTKRDFILKTVKTKQTYSASDLFSDYRFPIYVYIKYMRDYTFSSTCRKFEAITE